MNKKIQKLGLYGGSFDPVHNGHLILAREAAEQLELDKVLFIPARLSPHKTGRPPASAGDRLAVLRAALEGEELFAIDERELRREGVSFTIDTIKEIATAYPGAELFFFIGADNLVELHSWREIEQICSLVQLVVLGRGAGEGECEFPVIGRRIDISSTEIRNRVAQGLSISYLLPEKAISMIQTLHLYAR